MLVSVIIPAFNCEKSLKRTVDSIISSGLTDYEIVIVNDGSTDQSVEILNQYSGNQLISIIHQEGK